MKRPEFSKKTKLEAFQRSGGKCEGKDHFGPRLKLSAGNIEYHHDKECTFGGDGSLANCVVLCRACHRAITGSRAKAVAKSNRQRAAHIGAKSSRRKMPFGRDDKLKKKLNGTIVERKP